MGNQNDGDSFDPFGAPLVPHDIGTTSGVNDASGRHIGPYVLLRKIGQGGMGEVYEARRSEGFDDRVAIKLIAAPGEPSNAELGSGFRSERQHLLGYGTSTLRLSWTVVRAATVFHIS